MPSQAGFKLYALRVCRLLHWHFHSDQDCKTLSVSFPLIILTVYFGFNQDGILCALMQIKTQSNLPPHLRNLFQISTLYAAVCSSFKSNLDRSDAFTPFAPSHTVQATFIAHGVPWDKSLLLIQLLQSLVNCYKVNCFQSCFSSPFVELCNLGRCPTIE